MTYTSVGVHCYAGGFAEGMKDSFTQVAQLEEAFGKAGTFGTDTFHLNFPDIAQRNAEYHEPVMESWRPEQLRGANVVFGNPPCSAFSVVGSRKYMDDPVLNYTRNTVSAGLAVQPDIFVWECVPNIWGKGRPIIDWAAAEFERLGYQINVFFTNWVMHGAPTSRERFHFIATRYRLPLEEFRPKHFGFEDVITVRETIEDLEGHPQDPDWNHTWELPDPKALPVVERLRQGEGWPAGYARALGDGYTVDQLRKHRLIAGRMIYDAPSRTLLDMGCTFHPSLNRHITVREGARLCGYPDTFLFARSGNPYRRMTEVTKAVIPPAGRFLGRVFRAALEGGEKVRADGSLHVTDWRSQGRPYTPGRYFKKLPASVQQQVLKARARTA